MQYLSSDCYTLLKQIILIYVVHIPIPVNSNCILEERNISSIVFNSVYYSVTGQAVYSE